MEKCASCTHNAPMAAMALNLQLGYALAATWGEVIRSRKPAGPIQARTGKGSYVHPMTTKEVWIALHPEKDADQLGDRLRCDAGPED